VGAGPRAGGQLDGQLDGQSGAGTAILAQERLGGLLAASPRLHAGPDVVSALRSGRVDPRVLVVLAGLTVEHTVEVAALPVVGDEDPRTALRHQFVVSRLDGRPTDSAEVVAALTALLQGQSEPFSPVAVTSGPSGVTVGWLPSGPVPDDGP
jgi:hypothetical protein